MGDDLWMLLVFGLLLGAVVVVAFTQGGKHGGEQHSGEPSGCLLWISPWWYMQEKSRWQQQQLDEVKERLAQQEERLAQVGSPAAAPAERWSCACGNINPREEPQCLKCGGTRG